MVKCASLRFEDRQACLSESSESSRFCTHHEELALCLTVVNNGVEDYIIERELTLKSQKDIDSVNEVEDFMMKFQRTIMYGNGAECWFMKKLERKGRRFGQCKSLVLSNGLLCEEKNGYGSRYCRYHYIQNQVMCEAYHLRIDMLTYNVSQNTMKFAEFLLRRVFSFIYFSEDEFGHKIRFAELYNGGMFLEPYPSENFVTIDKSFYSEAKKYSATAEKSNLMKLMYLSEFFDFLLFFFI